MMHCLMYGVNCYNEISEVWAAIASKDSTLQVKYYASLLAQVQIFAEFFFDMLNE